MKKTTSALVIETNNLAGGDGDVVGSLGTLLTHLAPQLGSVDELVVTHQGPLAHGDILEKAAGRAIHFVELDVDAGYYEAKEHGFDATVADLVVFADSDCWPDAGWLALMLAPFENPDTKVVAGRTCYRDDLLGTAATTIDFMYFKSPFGAACTRNFYANNVAFRREVFDSVRYGDGGFYRGNCQVAGLKLVDGGVPVVFQPRAKTTHRFPDSKRELVQLRLLRGGDAVVMTEHLAHAMPSGTRWLMKLGPVSTALVLGGRFACSVRALNHQDMPRVRGPERAKTIAMIAGLSLVDAAGAVRGAFEGRHKNKQRVTLSYHHNVDGLAS